MLYSIHTRVTSSTMGKQRVGILFGGRSAEHEVSLQSARNVIAALDRDRFEPVLIGIAKDGSWHLGPQSELLLDTEDPSLIKLNTATPPVTLLPQASNRNLIRTDTQQPVGQVDVIFPVLHGPLGEDGTVQGLLRLANLPFVGSGVLGSAIGMDKDVMKRLLREANIPTVRFHCVTAATRATLDCNQVIASLGLPLFVKPANMGSSVGISKVHREADLLSALDLAFQFDTKVLIEEAIVGEEVECSVLGNERPVASLPGKIIPQAEFYSYTAKYIDEHGAILEIPADLPESVVTTVQQLAVRTFQVLELEGMARVDCFVQTGGEVIINEVNTIPGFTNISMYPKLWEVSGLPYTDLITKLIELAQERHAKQSALKTSYQ